MSVGALGASDADEDIAHTVACVESFLGECDHIGVAGVAKLDSHLVLLRLFIISELNFFLKARLAFGHHVVVWARLVVFYVRCLTPVAAFVDIEVTDVHAAEEALFDDDLKLADFARDVLTGSKISVLSLSRFGLVH